MSPIGDIDPYILPENQFDKDDKSLPPVNLPRYCHVLYIQGPGIRLPLLNGYHARSLH